MTQFDGDVQLTEALRSRYELADDVQPPAEPDAPTVDAQGQRLTTGI